MYWLSWRLVQWSSRLLRWRAQAEDGGEVEVHRTSIDIAHGGGVEPGDQADISVEVKDVQNPATCNSNDDVVRGGVKLSLHSGG